MDEIVTDMFYAHKNIRFFNTEGTSEDLTEKAQRECTDLMGFSPG